MKSRQIILVLILIITALPAKGQIISEPLDDFETVSDTAEFYKKLYHYAKSHKLLYVVYKSIFNPPVTVSKVPRKKKAATFPIEHYSGKVIRKIYIRSLEPFGTSMNDSTRVPHSVIQKVGNSTHPLTRRSTIRDRLLFDENEYLDPLKIAESERLLRSTGFIRDARITVKEIPGTKDTVDIVLLTQDYWTLRPFITASTSKASYRVEETNIAGLGHEVDIRFTDKLKEASTLIVDAIYRIPTLGSTYISPVVYFGTSDVNNVRGLSVNRPFYSPLTRIAGGLDLYSRSASDSTRLQDDTVYFDYQYRSFVIDGWSGISWKLLKGNTDEERSTRLVTALRYARMRYDFDNTNDAVIDYYFAPTDLVLGSISLSSRKYVKDRYIFKFGEAEDVPDGRKVTLTAGFENTPQQVRYYFGAEGAIGTYFPDLGYFYLSLGYSSYANKYHLAQGLVSSSLIYLTPLYQAHRWRIRNFTSLNLDYGIDRKFNERIYMNADDGLPGYKSNLPYGTSRLSISTQAVFYTPYEILGFRFAPILLAGIGMMGDYNSSILDSKIYQSYGFGLLIKNELLVMDTFQITIAWYPILPGSSADLRFDPVKLKDFRFHDFEITKPDVASFQ